MSSNENTQRNTPLETPLIKALTELRENIHVQMKTEFNRRLETDPIPTEDEIRIAAFKEWLEPQVRDAVLEMLRKGYSTKSSGFYGTQHDFQAIDGYFYIDKDTIKKLAHIGAEVLRGPTLGAPENTLISQIRFYPKEADIQKMKLQWDAIVALLPEKEHRPGICDWTEEFRQEFAPDHPSLEDESKLAMERLKLEVLNME